MTKELLEVNPVCFSCSTEESGRAIVPGKLGDRTIQVLSVRAARLQETVEQFRWFLAESEREQAARFRSPRLSSAFILARGTLRVLLGYYYDTDPARLQFTSGANGKPSLIGNGRIRFNVSHSGELVVLAFALDCEVGIDVEEINFVPRMDEIAGQFFCKAEFEELSSLPPDQRTRAFFCCWTRKEACIKCTGEGLSRSLASVRVTLRPGEEAKLLHFDHDGRAASVWTLHDLNLSSSYAAALAYRDELRPVHISLPIDPSNLLHLA